MVYFWRALKHCGAGGGDRTHTPLRERDSNGRRDAKIAVDATARTSPGVPAPEGMSANAAAVLGEIKVPGDGVWLDNRVDSLSQSGSRRGAAPANPRMLWTFSRVDVIASVTATVRSIDQAVNEAACPLLLVRLAERRAARSGTVNKSVAEATS